MYEDGSRLDMMRNRKQPHHISPKAREDAVDEAYDGSQKLKRAVICLGFEVTELHVCCHEREKETGPIPNTTAT